MTAVTDAQEITLVDAVDRLLGKGVSILGDVVISIADVDLVYLSLRTLLASVDTVTDRQLAPALPAAAPSRRSSMANSQTRPPAGHTSGSQTSKASPTRRGRPSREAAAGAAPSRRLETDPENVDRGLAQLVLTVVELIRQLMERQALRRVEAGSLTAQQEEDVGIALMKLAEKMEELKDHFELDDDDLNIHLGPLGDLV